MRAKMFRKCSTAPRNNNSSNNGLLILRRALAATEWLNRTRRQRGFPTFISCQRQDVNVLPKRRQSHQGDKLCDVSTVPLVARWPVFLARGSRCELRIGRGSESNRCYTVRKGLWERTTLGRRYFFNFVTLLAVIWLDGEHYFSAGM